MTGQSPGGMGPPANSPPAAIADPCSYLAELRAAYYSLLAGRQSVRVRHNNYEQWFNHGSAVEMQREIRRLELMCPRGLNNPHGGRLGAVRAGPYSTGGIGHPALGPMGYPTRRY